MVPSTLTDAHLSSTLAYLDGGTGSMALQAALACALTTAYFVRGQWATLKTAVSRKVHRRSER